MEGAIIVGEYHTAITKCKLPSDGPTKEELWKNVKWATVASSLLAVVIIGIVAIPLAVLSKDFDESTASIIEGVSKIIAAICILQLSLKMPKWLGFYKKRNMHGHIDDKMDMTTRSIRFNVAWNIWREVAECGAFILPFLLQGDQVAAVPLSALAGAVIGLLIGAFIFWANQKFENKFKLAVYTTLLLVFLSTGLFVGGCHEFEEVWGETKKIWKIENPFWSHKKFPMVIIKPFGYSSSRTMLQICTFWIWLSLSAGFHAYFIHCTRKVEAEEAEKAANHDDVKEVELGEKGDGTSEEAEEETATA